MAASSQIWNFDQDFFSLFNLLYKIVDFEAFLGPVRVMMMMYYWRFWEPCANAMLVVALVSQRFRQRARARSRKTTRPGPRTSTPKRGRHNGEGVVFRQRARARSRKTTRPGPRTSTPKRGRTTGKESFSANTRARVGGNFVRPRRLLT